MRASIIIAQIMVVAAVSGALCPAHSQVPQLQLVQQTEKRVALVVGISRYQHLPKIDSPVSDARLLVDALRRVGFTVVGDGPQLDLDKPSFERAIRRFGGQISQARVALFYYAGHGLQARGANWLVPAPANPVRDNDIDFELIDAGLVLRQMESGGARLNFMILDASRNSPFAERGFRTVSRGLAEMQAPEGTLIVYAAQPGSLAMEGIDGNSPFAKSLAQVVQRPGLGVLRTFNEVGLQVKRATDGAQQPWVSSSPIDGEFFFTAHPAASAPIVVPTPEPIDADLATWSAIKDTNNTDSLREYVRQFPEGRFASLAQLLIQDLTTPRPPSQQTAAISTRIASFDESRIRAAAARLAVALPARLNGEPPAASVPADMARYFGAWRSERPWGGSGRNAMLIVTKIDGLGAVSGFLSLGRGQRMAGAGQGSMTVPIEPYIDTFEGTIGKDGLIFYWSWPRIKYVFTISPRGLMLGTVDEGPDVGAQVALRRID
jgi:hypothetical protein